jgi:uncharacterized Ntn-hydrolase superfamily protein
MRRCVFAVIVWGASQTAAFATWSVVAVDGRTGTVAIASATCVAQAQFAGFPAKGLMDIQAIVVPGKGVAAAQANVDSTRKNQDLIFREIQKGTAPAEIIQMLKADPAIESRQFGIVEMDGRRDGFSGTTNSAASIDIQGQVPGEQIFFSIQGNILASEAVVHEAVKAFTSTTGTLTDRVMAAMEAADRTGGDKRCNCNTVPQLVQACDAKTADVAYILRADRKDATGSSFNDGVYGMYISVTDNDLHPDENANPVKTLRMRYDAWMKTHPG